MDRHSGCRSRVAKLQFPGLCIHGFFPAEPNALVPNPLQLFRLGGQGAETETGFFREFSQLPSNPPTQALFSGKALYGFSKHLTGGDRAWLLRPARSPR